jgi:hypothetical protein
LAACVTVTVCPAIVSVPVRAAPVVLAATVKFVEPRPDIEAPLVTVIHETDDVEVHGQLEPVVTAMLLFVPVDGAVRLVVDTL